MSEGIQCALEPLGYLVVGTGVHQDRYGRDSGEHSEEMDIDRFHGPTVEFAGRERG